MLRLNPRTKIHSVYQLTPEWLAERGIKAVICDVDDTLTPYFDTTPTGRLVEWKDTLARAGIRLFILSNGKRERIEPFCRALGIDCLALAMKPLPFGFIHAVHKIGLKKSQVITVGDQIFTDIAGGNLAGLHTVLVDPLAYKTGTMEKKKRQWEKKYRCAKPI